MKVTLDTNSGFTYLCLEAETVQESAQLLLFHNNTLKRPAELSLHFSGGKVEEQLVFGAPQSLNTLDKN